MSIRRTWRVASTTARNALSVTDADVQEGSEAQDNSTGFIYRLIRAVSGSDSSWTLVSPIAMGTWTPTAASVSNLDSTPTPQAGVYIRVGSVVAFFVEVQGVDPTTGSTTTEYTITTPVTSNFAAAGDVAGTLGTTFSASRVFADTTNDRIRCMSLSSGTAAVTQYVIGGMKVL